MTEYICKRYYTDSSGGLHPVTWKDTVVEYTGAIVCALLTAYGLACILGW